MRRATIIQPLALSLSLLVWEEAEIAQCLTSRLPRRWAPQAKPLAQKLVRAFPGRTAPDARQIAGLLNGLPEIDALCQFARARGLTLDAPLAAPRFLPLAPFDGIDLPQLSTCAALAEWLAIPPETLIRFADLRGLSARSTDPFGPHYLHHLQPKSNGELRLIEEPRPFLKKLQRRILTGLLNPAPVHSAARGFCPGRNVIGNAALHGGEALVIGFDLRHFFAGIGAHRLYGLFRSFGYPRTVARDLAGLTSAVTPEPVLRTGRLAARDALSRRHLPQGAPTSPALANAVAYRLDCRLAGLARALGANYSRYADDLTFSGDPHIRQALLQAVPEIVAKEGFQLNPQKTRIMPAHCQQRVTGIVVNRGVNVPRKEFDRLKAVLHRLKDREDPRRADPRFLAQISGQIAWVEALNPARGGRLRAALDGILAA